MIFRLVAAGVAGVAMWGQESTAALENPFNSDTDVARGEKIFGDQCASCHGRDGRGGAAGPDLSTGTFRRTSTDEGLFQIVNKGIPGTTMPAFALNPGPAWQVVAYVRSLGRNRAAQSSGGDARRGGELYARHGCGGCHTSTGPDLAGIGRRRTVAELRQSIGDPQAEVDSAYWRIRGRTADGKTIAGQRLNEDTVSIQYREAGGALRSVKRSNIRLLEYDRTSAMPSFKSKLTESEMNDLIAHLLVKGAQ